MRTYAIGDIHGQLDMLHGAHALIEADRHRTNDATAPVVHLGDLVDRGPDSKGVIQFLIDGENDAQPWITLKGNHDRMFNWFMLPTPKQDPHYYMGFHWLHDRIGGVATLQSYDIEVHEKIRMGAIHEQALANVPPAHLAFLEARPLSFQRGEVFYVHAGIRPGVALADQTEEDLLWIREGFLDDPRDHGPLIVHGHTALDQATHFGNRIDLDAGAGYGRPISVAVFEGRNAFTLSESGRTPLLPV